MTPFITTPLAIPDVIAIDPVVRGDTRGWFVETYKRSAFEALRLPHDFAQDNHARSEPRHVLRGLHFQVRPSAQGKLVRCVAGAIFDVAVDIRRESSTFGKWVSAELSASDHKMLWVPPGFAHGYLTIAEGTEVAYKTTVEYSPQHERVVSWSDPDLQIEWPTSNPILSDRDHTAPSLQEWHQCESW